MPTLIRRSVLAACLFLVPTLKAQSTDALFADRAAILASIEAFYVGDHTGSESHRRASMHPEGAYRYLDRDGVYREDQFRLVEGGADTSYVEELLSIEVYGTVALVRVRQESQWREDAEYKLVTLHKTDNEWLITSIAWGWGVTP
ncbi:MAG: nuclear transport factor 2 family protein [Bacteroidota bacterium]